MKSFVVDCSPESLKSAAACLRSGGLVAFPTETVYGLGAVITDEKAIASIFEAKGRPRTDPLIVHVTNFEMAFSLSALSRKERVICEKLVDKFWPGPLTLVVRASQNVSRSLTSGLDFVGIRAPAHPVAQQLIKETGIPVAAPSANRFGHVSPTTAQHVLSDLSDKGVMIVDGGHCDVGIESTVLRILSETELEILRPGRVTLKEIEECLRGSDVSVKLNSLVKKETSVAQTSPGQLLTHYAPDLPAYLAGEFDNNYSQKIHLNECVLIDFAQQYLQLKNKVKKYFEISSTGNPQEAAANLFWVLREAEKVEGAKCVIIADVRKNQDEKLEAIFDRVKRATSGKTALVKLGSDQVCV